MSVHASPDQDQERPVRLLHLSDIHLAPLPAFSWRHWNLKRALGYANWQRNRQYVHTRDALDLITEHIKQRACDHILVGGDLINLGLPEEYAEGLRWLLELGRPNDVAVVPGNHDIYTRLWTEPGVARWHAYMMGSAQPGIEDAAPSFAPVFPYVRVIRNVAVIGVNTAVPTWPGFASGRVGSQQLGDLARILKWSGDKGLFRLILMHHPPQPDQARAAGPDGRQRAAWRD